MARNCMTNNVLPIVLLCITFARSTKCSLSSCIDSHSKSNTAFSSRDKTYCKVKEGEKQ